MEIKSAIAGAAATIAVGAFAVVAISSANAQEAPEVEPVARVQVVGETVEKVAPVVEPVVIPEPEPAVEEPVVTEPAPDPAPVPAPAPAAPPTSPTAGDDIPVLPVIPDPESNEVNTADLGPIVGPGIPAPEGSDG